MSESSRLSRWSQRKLAARRGGALPEPDAIAPAIEQDELDKTTGKKPAGAQALAPARDPNLPAAADAKQDEEMLTEADLPPIEDLSAQSDYTVFLQKNVPEVLRRRALRKLWVSDPVLANLDGLNDYDEDFTIVTAMTMDDTIYKIGRGLLGDEPEPEPKPETAESDAPPLAESAVETAAPDEEPEALTGGDSDAPPAVAADESAPVGQSDSEDGNASDPAKPKSSA